MMRHTPGMQIALSFRGRTLVWLKRYAVLLITLMLTASACYAFWHYYQNGLGIAYNDARSHLDIGRRVVEGLNVGFAQLGSVWLPLTHLLMGATIWNDFMWHSGLAGALWSMLSFVATGVLIYLYLRELGAGLTGRLVGVALFATNLNALYLQSTAMTEFVLIGTMTAGAYFLLRWYQTENTLHLIYTAFFIMLASLVRYDGWFLFFCAALLITLFTFRKHGYWHAEGIFIFFCTLAGFGVFLWLLWNALIFKDPLYFAFGPYSAHTQQEQLSGAGVLPTKGDWLFSTKMYMYAFAYNVGAFSLVLGVVGMLALWFDRAVKSPLRQASVVLIAPFLFNILALYLGHSVLYIQGISGDTWFNVRYGIMMLPSVAIFVGYLVHRAVGLRAVLIGLLTFVTFFQFASADAVTIDDALVGSSQKNVTEVSSWLREHAGNQKGFILISAASHDSIIFSSGLPMKRFIHEGAGAYYDAAIEYPDRWARWIVVRSYSDDDSTWRLLKDNPGFLPRYTLVDRYPFADIYQLKDEYLDKLNTEDLSPPPAQDLDFSSINRVSRYLNRYAASQSGYILISVALHDPIVFSSGLPMKRFIHETTGEYYQEAIHSPDHWVRWIVMRTHSDQDQTWKLMEENPSFRDHYHLVLQDNLADIYEINDEFLGGLHADTSP